VAGLAEYHRDALPVPGTLQYAAPEYLLGEGGSQRTELFALAAITYQMLSGQLPTAWTRPRAHPGRPAPPALHPRAICARTCRRGSTRCWPRPSGPLPSGRR
jgi:serine/threonine protein kinase